MRVWYKKIYGKSDKMSFNRMMAKMMSGGNVKVIHGEVVGNVNPYIEWIKWLSYIPEFQQLRMQELNCKSIDNASLEELDEIRKYKNQSRILSLFKIYGTSEISKKEYMEVYDFMVKHSIDDLMLSKLSVEELKYAREQIQHFSEVSNEELRQKVKSEQNIDSYKNLSMVDSYILHIISRINFARSMIELDEEIKARINANDVMRQKSLYYAANPYARK